MHKGVILLVQAEDRKNAVDKVKEFLQPYGDGYVWDYYIIGNRWHNTLAPKDKVDLFMEWMKENYPKCFDGDSYPIDYIENETDRPIIQAKWRELGLKSYSPFYSGYGFEIPDRNNEYDDTDYNVVPLSECLDTVKEWLLDTEKEADEYWQKAEEARAQEKKGAPGTMSGYYAGIYKKYKYRSFSFESCVFDVENETSEQIPDDPAGWWAVMVDMHN